MSLVLQFREEQQFVLLSGGLHLGYQGQRGQHRTCEVRSDAVLGHETIHTMDTSHRQLPMPLFAPDSQRCMGQGRKLPVESGGRNSG